MLFERDYEDEPSAKDYERTRRAGAGSKDFQLTPNTPLSCREEILKNSKKKSILISILCGYPLQNNVQLDARDIHRFGRDFNEGGVVTPYVSSASVAPHGLLVFCDWEMHVAVPSICTQRRINWLTIMEHERERG